MLVKENATGSMDSKPVSRGGFSSPKIKLYIVQQWGLNETMITGFPTLTRYGATAT